MKAKELDVVLLKDGTTGTVIDVYDGGEFYMVELDHPDLYEDAVDATVTVPADEIDSVEWVS